MKKLNIVLIIVLVSVLLCMASTAGGGSRPGDSHGRGHVSDSAGHYRGSQN